MGQYSLVLCGCVMRDPTIRNRHKLTGDLEFCLKSFNSDFKQVAKFGNVKLYSLLISEVHL